MRSFFVSFIPGTFFLERIRDRAGYGTFRKVGGGIRA